MKADNISPAETADTLFTALNSADLDYAIRETETGARYAGFRLSIGDADLQSFTSIVDGGNLRVTAHGVCDLETGDVSSEYFELQRQLPIARLLPGEDNPIALDLALAVNVSNAVLTGGLVKALLAHMQDNIDELHGRPGPESRQAPSVSGSWADVPLDEELGNAGYASTQAGGAYEISSELPGLPIQARLQVYHLGPGWIRISGLCSPALQLDRLQDDLIGRLQHWAPVGRFTDARENDTPVLGAEVAVPLLGREPTAALVAGIEDALRLLGTAYSHASRGAPA